MVLMDFMSSGARLRSLREIRHGVNLYATNAMVPVEV
jgi:hypothetical protein